MSGEYFVDELKLTVCKSAFLVSVTVLKERGLKQDPPETLPDWLFNSKMTIWLLDENSPLYKRAQRGDEIKRHLAMARDGAFSVAG